MRPVPRAGYATVSPYLICAQADEVVRLACTAFGAAPLGPEIRRPDGSLMHAALRIGDSVVMIGAPQRAGVAVTAMLHIYVEDCDATWRAALAAGAEPEMEPALQPHGDRAAMVRDAGGNLWWIATPVEDVPPEEIVARAHPGG